MGLVPAERGCWQAADGLSDEPLVPHEGVDRRHKTHRLVELNVVVAVIEPYYN